MVLAEIEPLGLGFRDIEPLYDMSVLISMGAGERPPGDSLLYEPMLVALLAVTDNVDENEFLGKEVVDDIDVELE